ncbi:MAG: hypothetical protein FGM35_00060 [Rhodocyclaceae bacterium]|jgi:hypothetical protein|nr:hypothetical protein [Rhodocyclaceae bacterium]
MKLKIKTGLTVSGLALFALVSQPVLADGGWHHRGHRSYHHSGNWVPFALGAVVGGVAIGAMLQPQPVVVQPPYYPPPPVYVRPRVVVPAPVYPVPMSPTVYYTY